MIKAIVFDLDQTLIDFLRMKRISCEAAVDAMISAGLRIGRKEGMRIIYRLYAKHGMEYQRIFEAFLLEVLGRIDYGILASGIVAYRRVKEGLLYPYPNVIPTLNALRKKYKLAILSDAPRIQAWIRLAAMGLQDSFSVVVTFDDTRTEKPNRKPFLLALKRLKLKPEECVMVGDSLKKDIAPANRLGFRTVFAKYGGNSHPARTKPNYTINDIGELLKIRL